MERRVPFKVLHLCLVLLFNKRLGLVYNICLVHTCIGGGVFGINTYTAMKALPPLPPLRSV